MKVTLTDDEGHRRRSKIKNGHMSQTITLTDIIPGTKVQYNKRHLMHNLISLFDLDLRSRSQLKVKGHRHCDVCVF